MSSKQKGKNKMPISSKGNVNIQSWIDAMMVKIKTSSCPYVAGLRHLTSSKNRSRPKKCFNTRWWNPRSEQNINAAYICSQIEALSFDLSAHPSTLTDAVTQINTWGVNISLSQWGVHTRTWSSGSPQLNTQPSYRLTRWKKGCA